MMVKYSVELPLNLPSLDCHDANASEYYQTKQDLITIAVDCHPVGAICVLAQLPLQLIEAGLLKKNIHLVYELHLVYTWQASSEQALMS